MFLRGLAPVILLVSSLAMADDALVIEHNPSVCMLTGKFPQIEARIARAGTGATTARVYFRATDVPYWSSVPMKLEGDVMKAALPKPPSNAHEVYYYIEARDSSAGVTRSADFLSAVIKKPDLCPGAGQIAKALDSASPVVEKGAAVTLTEAKGVEPIQPKGSGGNGKWIALGLVGAAGAGAGIAVASHSGPPTSIPRASFTGALSGYVQHAQSTCIWDQSVTPGTITINVSGSQGNAGFSFGSSGYTSTDFVTGCNAPSVSPPLNDTFASLAFDGVTVQGMTVLESKTFVLQGTFANSRIKGTIAVSGGVPGFNWDTGIATFDLGQVP